MRPAGGRNGHIASLRLLNKERWDAQLQSQEQTGNHLFNRPNPFYQGAEGENDGGYVRPYVRTKHPDRDGYRLDRMRGTVHWVKEDGKLVKDQRYADLLRNDQNGELKYEDEKLKYVPITGIDRMSIPIDSAEKYRIPGDSVVNKVGDCKLCFCFGWRLTAAQWIWWLNFFCFLAHTTMIFVTFYFAYWQHGLDMTVHGHGDHMLVQIHRISMIPTPRMIELGEASWAAGWNNSLGHTEFYVKDNHQMVRPNATLSSTRARFSGAVCAAGQLRDARRHLLRHLGRLPPLGPRLRRLRELLVLVLAPARRRLRVLALD